MSDSNLTSDWSKGANNIAAKDRLPEGFARDIVNADPTPGGKLELRIGYSKLYTGTDVRGVLSLGSKLLIADGTSLVEFNTDTNSSRVIGTIPGAGAFVGEELDGELYFCTENACLRYDGQTLRSWGVPDVNYQPNVSASTGGGLLAGYYQIAMTYTDQWGLEGGTDKPIVLQVPANGKIDVSIPALPAGCVANIYIGSINGSTLYLQQSSTVSTTLSFTVLRDDTAQCTTVLKRAPAPGHYMTSHNGVLVVAQGHVVQMTMPMQRHLVDRVTGFFQYGTDVGMVLSVAEVLYVSADKLYELSDVELAGVSQRPVLEYPAVAGTGVLLPDGKGAWMSKYGAVITDGQTLQTVNRETFAPAEATSGAAGVVDNNGNQLVVTTLKGTNKPNALAASDYYIAEVYNP